MQIFLSSARTVSSNRDFGVEQFFRADEFRADDPSPNVSIGTRIYLGKVMILFSKKCWKVVVKLS